MRSHRFAIFVWAVLAYNILVVLWGAFVRATGSGAGCGSHWPLCNGTVIPRAPEVATMIEFTHRLTSGIALLLVAAVLWLAMVRHARHQDGRSARSRIDSARLPRPWSSRWRSAARAVLVSVVAQRPWSAELWAAVVAMAFMISEALVGAGLVLFELTGQNDSMMRAVVLGVHLINTFFLLAAMALTGWYAAGHPPMRLRQSGVLPWLLGLGVVATLAVGVTGAITALGDTLFPAASLRDGFRQDFDSGSHILLRLRILHPALAITTGIYLLVAALAIQARRPDRWSQRLARLLITLFVVQLAAGFVNLLLLAPVWMQIVHLLLADMVWLTLILLAAAALAERAPVTITSSGVAIPSLPSSRPRPAVRAR